MELGQRLPLSARLLALAAIWLAWPALADFPPSERDGLSLQGFGTLGLVYNDGGQAEFLRDRSQPEGPADGELAWETDSRLGIQANWRPQENLEAVLQLVSKLRYDGSYRPQVSWAFLKYALNPNLQLRLGRLGYDVYLRSDSRDVGYSYLWVRPPAGYFGQVHFTHFDGLDLVASGQLGNGILQGKLYLGHLNETNATPIGVDYEMTGTPLWGGYLDYQDPHWQLRTGLGAINIKRAFPPYAPVLDGLRATGSAHAVALADDLDPTKGRFYYASAGIVYDAGPLQTQLQLRRLWTDTQSYQGNTSGYWSLGYRIGRWTPYVVLSRATSEHSDSETGLPETPEFASLNAGVDQIVQATQIDQDTLSLGTRFDFAKNAALKFQVDLIRSHDVPSLLWVDSDPNWDGDATLFSVALDFVF